MYEPIWEGKIEGYAKNQIAKQLWRFSHLGYEYEDLVHECWICFDSCRREYGVLNTPQHFMSLFKITIHNQFYDLARKSSYHKENLIDEEFEEEELSICFECDSGFHSKIRQAPEEVKAVISLVLNAPREVLEMIGFTKKGSRSLLGNERLCNLLGFNHKTDLIGMVKSYFSQ